MKSRPKSPSTRRGLTNSNTRVEMRRSRRCRDGQSSAILRGKKEGVQAKDEHRVSHFLAVGFICDMLLYCVGNSKKERTESRQFIQPTTKEGTNIDVARDWAPVGRYFAAAWTRLDSTCSVGGCQRRMRMWTNRREGGGPADKIFCNLTSNKSHTALRQGTK